MSIQNQFFVLIPSNDRSSTYINQPNRFRTHLARTLDLSGNWVVGLHSISYTYSWNNLGTLENQWIQLHLNNEDVVRIPIPSSSYTSAKQLEKALRNNIQLELETYLQERDKEGIINVNKQYAEEEALQREQREILIEPEKAPDPVENNEVESMSLKSIRPFERLIESIRGKPIKKGEEFKRENAYFPFYLANNEIRDLASTIGFEYNQDMNKFKMVFYDEEQIKLINYVSLSDQIGYLLGFANPDHVIRGETAKYSADLKGGITSFGVYAKGLTENIVCGSELVSMLRVVTVTGEHKFGDTVEQIYNTPIFIKVLPKQVTDIEIELRSMAGDGRLMPMQFGNTLIVLVFKKIINF